MSKKKLDLYLAHNFNDRKEIRAIELRLEQEFGINLHNPFYDTIQRKDIAEIDSGKALRWDLDMAACRNIVRRDLSAIKKRDGILTIIKSPSIGTTLEIAYAKEHKKKIFVISETYIQHPWLKIYADYRFKTIKDFKQWLEKNGYGKTKTIHFLNKGGN